MTAVTGVGAMSIVQRLQWVGLAVLCLSTAASAVKCFDCVGEDCVGSFCEGQYCMLSKFAPRWGSAEWGAPQTVKGCMSGTMLRDDVRDHCEANLEDGIEVFTCFCNKDYCNGPKQVRKLKIEPVELYTCVCDGEHCDGKSCVGELCTYVVNHKNKRTEQGCVNASIPLIERRTLGACMMPPITGAMHHSIAKEVEDLLNTESCTCASDYCNTKKPVIEVDENMKCKMNVRANLMGAEMNSRTISCSGEYCFKVNATSELGYMRSFGTIGCVSFIEGSELAEELEITGCAKFQSEKLTVNACFFTNDTKALARARSHVQPKHRLVTAAPEKHRRPTKETPFEFEPAPPVAEEGVGESEKEEKEEKEEEEEREEEEEQKSEHAKQHHKSHKEEESEKPVETFIFQGPTEAPVPEDSNTTLVAVFVVIMVIIVIAGVIWKFELHKKVFRSSYDTVAGG